jgi:glycerophosphoryl diester phosphodiesterase
MKGFYRQNFALLFRNLPALLWFELLYKMLAALVLYPLILTGLDYAIKRSGLTFLTDKNLKVFLSNPVSLAIGVLLIIIMVVFALYELSVLVICFEKSRLGEKVNAIEIAFAGLTKLRKFLHPIGFIYFFVLLAALTFLDFPFASVLVSVTGIPDFLHRTFQDNSILYWFAIGISAVVLWFFWSYIFTIHFIVLRGMRFKEAIEETRKLIRGRVFRINVRFLFWYLVVFALLFVLYALVLVAGAAIIMLAFPKDTELVAFLTLSRAVGSGASFLLYSFFTPFFFVVVSTYFQKMVLEKGLQPKNETAPLKIRSFKSHRVILGLLLLAIIGTNAGILVQSLSDGVIRRIVFARTPEITAHRGSSLEDPENTIAAVEKAIEEGADYAEIDVRMTKDGTVVLMHDASLKRTTGAEEMVWDVSLEDLKQLDAGASFSEEFAGEEVPTLEEVIDFASGRIRLNIEIKISSVTPDLPQKVAELIVLKDFSNQCVVTSFNYNALGKVKTVSEDIRTGLIITMPLGSYTELEHVDFYSLNALFISARQVDMIHRLGYEIHVWGVKDEQIVRKMVDFGVDNIIATDPIMAREAVYAQSANDFVILIAKLFFGQNDIVRRNSFTYPLRY